MVGLCEFIRQSTTWSIDASLRSSQFLSPRRFHCMWISLLLIWTTACLLLFYLRCILPERNTHSYSLRPRRHELVLKPSVILQTFLKDNRLKILLIYCSAAFCHLFFRDQSEVKWNGPHLGGHITHYTPSEWSEVKRSSPRRPHYALYPICLSQTNLSLENRKHTTFKLGREVTDARNTWQSDFEVK